MPKKPKKRPFEPSGESVMALSAVYASDRSDLSAARGHVLTIFSILAVYAAAVGGLLARGGVTAETWFAAAAAPLPTWIALAGISMLNAIIISQGRSALLIENRLVEAAGVIPPHRGLLGTSAVELATNLTTQSVIGKSMLVFVSGGSLLVVSIFTAYALHLVAINTGGLSIATILTSACYLMIYVGFGAWWVSVVRRQLLDGQTSRLELKTDR